MSTNISTNEFSFNFHLPVKVIFGRGTAKKLVSSVESFSAKKILICSDENIQKIGIVDLITKSLQKRYKIKVYTEIQPEPTVQTYEEVTNIVRDDNFNLIIGVGGGSVLDTSKVAAAMATNPGELKDYTPQVFNINLFKKKSLPLILLPTTAGTGSEVTSIAMIVDGDFKIFMSSPYLYADFGIIDPELTLTAPPKLTAFTGIDALSHVVESMMSTRSNPITEAIALRAANYIGKYLKRAYDNSHDIEARSGMSLAALLGGIALSAGAVYGHSISYTIAARYNLSHGISCAISLPYIMKYNLSVCTPLFSELAKSLGARIENTSEKTAYQVVFQVKKIIEDLNLPTKLSSIGVKKEILPILAKECIERYPRKNNPRELTYQDALMLYENMWEGMV